MSEPARKLLLGKVSCICMLDFEFRDKKYASTNTAGTVVMERISNMDSVVIRDVKEKNDFKRFINDSLIAVPDSLARRYMNSINSVHYFSRLPYGLNDGAEIDQPLFAG